jgi:hypothetical protein
MTIPSNSLQMYNWFANFVHFLRNALNAFVPLRDLIMGTGKIDAFKWITD